MKWKKLGLVFGPNRSLDWAKSHAMIPTPVLINDQVIRVFVTFCDDRLIGRPGFVDVSSTDPTQVLNISDKPLLETGEPGTFDENGLLVCSVVNLGSGLLYMYYAGFELGTKIRYRLLTGLAISEDFGNTFHKVKKTPILERSDSELFFRAGPYCLHENGIFKLWYVGGSEWVELNGKSMPVYDIRYLESLDGINWPSEGKIVLPITEPDEHGFGRPYVVKKSNNLYQMYYSIRRRSFGAYRLGYAESENGVVWNRMDNELNLDTSEGSFDSDAIMYSAPITVNSKTYLFYNGNDFGRSGFAVAVLED